MGTAMELTTPRVRGSPCVAWRVWGGAQNPKADEREEDKTFTFDHAYGMETTQREVYNTTASPIVESVLEGYNGTIFACVRGRARHGSCGQLNKNTHMWRAALQLRPDGRGQVFHDGGPAGPARDARHYPKLVQGTRVRRARASAHSANRPVDLRLLAILCML